MKTNRREFILNSLLMTAGLSSVSAVAKPLSTQKPSSPSDTEVFKISIFSKHLQWLNYAEMAQVAAQIGFDGIDITVRPSGHVLPERVAEDLPKAVNAIRQAGMNVYMITTAITGVTEGVTRAFALLINVVTRRGFATVDALAAVVLVTAGTMAETTTAEVGETVHSSARHIKAATTAVIARA